MCWCVYFRTSVCCVCARVCESLQPTPPTTKQRRPSNRRFRRLSQGPPLSQPSSSVGLSPLTTPSTDAPSTVTPSGLVFVTSGDMSEQDAAGVVQ
jgi:hypothetical protein